MYAFIVFLFALIWGLAVVPAPSLGAHSESDMAPKRTNPVLGPTVQLKQAAEGILTPGNPWSPGHPQNVPGTPFAPLPSTPQKNPLEGADLGDLVTFHNATTSVSNAVGVVNAPAAFNNTLVGCTPIMQVTFPTPMPALVQLDSKRTVTSSLFSPGQGLNASAAVSPSYAGGFRQAQGRFIIKWGIGENQFHAFTDLATGTFQVPAATAVQVYAHVFAPNFTTGDKTFLARATVRPGLSPYEARASFTAAIYHAGGDGTPSLGGVTHVPPYARSFTMGAWDEDTGLALADRSRAILELGAVKQAQFMVVAPDITTPAVPGFSTPVDCVDVPVPANEQITYSLAHDGAGDGSALLVFEVSS